MPANWENSSVATGLEKISFHFNPKGNAKERSNYRTIALISHASKVKVKEKSLSRVRLCDPVNFNLQGSSVHGTLQARILEWVAISFSRGSSRPRDRTLVSCIIGRRFNF